MSKVTNIGNVRHECDLLIYRSSYLELCQYNYILPTDNLLSSNTLYNSSFMIDIMFINDAEFNRNCITNFHNGINE